MSKALITAVVKAIEKVAAKSDLDADTKKLVDDVVAKAELGEARK